jgi:hypothetical protein
VQEPEPDRVQPAARCARQKRADAMPGTMHARRWTLDFDLMDCAGFHIGSGCTVKARSRCRRQEGPGTTLKRSPVNWGDGGGLSACCVAGRGVILLQCGHTRGRVRGLYTRWGIATSSTFVAVEARQFCSALSAYQGVDGRAMCTRAVRGSRNAR